MGRICFEISTRFKRLRDLTFGISPDTIFLGLISLFSLIALPMIRMYGKKMCTLISRVEILELVALRHHPDILKEMRDFKS